MIRLILILALAVICYLYFVEFWSWTNTVLARIFFWLFP